MNQKDLFTLFSGALEVMNRAIELHGDTFPCKSDLEGMEQILGNQTMLVAIHDDDPSSPIDHFRIQVKGGKLELYARGKDEPEAVWKVSKEYLQGLVQNQQDYIKHPEKLDLNWLRSQLEGTG